MSSADLALDLLLMSGRDDETRRRARASWPAARPTRTHAGRSRRPRSWPTRAGSIDGDPDIGAQNMLIVAGEGWHRGVIGIVASKLVDIYSKPAHRPVDRGRRGARIRHGAFRRSTCSGALEACADVFLRFGGHRQAAGVTLEAARLGELRQRLSAWANERLGPDDLVPRLRIDSPLGLREISGDVIEGLTRLGPFGAANPEARLSRVAGRSDGAGRGG